MDTREWTRRIKEYMDTHHMAGSGDGILAAVSGGADSVCLLLVLKELEEELGIRLAAFHLNHGLRGDEADRDEQFVRELCARMDIPLKVVHELVGSYAKEHGLSEEEAGRLLRYRHLEEAAAEFGCGKIATAHHKNDQAETVLFNLFRGSGLKGLGGIRPMRGAIVRPLLAVTREEIETYLYKKKADWCEDSTNRDNVYERNKVRNVLLPWVTEHINEQAVSHVVKTAEFAAQADAYFMDQVEKLRKEWQIFRNEEDKATSVAIGARAFDEQHPILKPYLLRAMIRELIHTEKDISSRHLEAICALTGPGGGTMADLPYGLVAVRSYDTLEIRDRALCERPEDRMTPMALIPGETLILERNGTVFESQIFEWKKELEIPKNECTKWFDYDKIKAILFVRTRESGDFFEIGGGKRKLLKRFFIDEKIPEAERDNCMLLADGDHIVWIIGHRISEAYKLTDSTRTVLEIRVHKGEVYGREN